MLCLAMELSKQTLDGLGLVSSANFDDASFKALLGTAFRVAAGEAKAGEEEKLAKSGEKAALITKQAYTAVLTVILEGAKHNAPASEISGVSWRMDYYMRSNLLEKVKTPLYYLQLNTTNNQGQTGSVPLTLSLEEMHDLLAKCKDMAKQVERVTAGK